MFSPCYVESRTPEVVVRGFDEDSFGGGGFFQDVMKLSTLGHLCINDLLHNVVLGINDIFCGQYFVTNNHRERMDPLELRLRGECHLNAMLLCTGRHARKICAVFRRL